MNALEDNPLIYSDIQHLALPGQGEGEFVLSDDRQGFSLQR